MKIYVIYNQNKSLQEYENGQMRVFSTGVQISHEKGEHNILYHTFIVMFLYFSEPLLWILWY